LLLLLGHPTPTPRHVEIDRADVRIGHSRRDGIAVVGTPSIGISSFGHQIPGLYRVKKLSPPT
jgi:hypothetical protein